MKYKLLQNSFLDERKKEEYPFSIEERKWAAEAIADCYKRIENKGLNSCIQQFTANVILVEFVEKMDS